MSRVAILVVCSASLYLLSGCGSNPSPVALTPLSSARSPLDGNWLLTGTIPTVFTPSASFSLAMTFDVNGNQIAARDSESIPCTNGGSVGSGDGGASGSLAMDGSFTVRSESLPPGVTLPTPDSIQITGTVPATARASWSGTYTYTPGSSTCAHAMTAAFTATPIQNITGAYSGSAKITKGPQTFGSGTPITLQLALQQGVTVTPTTGSAYFKASALSGTITVNGTSCFTHGTSSSVNSIPYSVVAGSFFASNFQMDDGSSVALSGDLLNADASRLNVRILTVRGGACDGEFGSAFELDQ